MRFEITGMREFTDVLLRMASTDYVAAVTEALTDGGGIAVRILKESADQHHGGGTGRMRDSITASAPVINEYGGYMTIKLKGTVSGKWRYRDQGAELNYGSGRRSASGWFDKGQEEAQPEVEKAMINVLEAWIASAESTA